MRKLLMATACGIALTACDTWMGEAEKPPLPGKRIAILEQGRATTPDASMASAEVELPPPEPNEDWTQPGGYAPHALHHLELGDRLQRAWSADVGSGTGDRAYLWAQPIVAEGKIFAMDAEAGVTALDAAGGSKLWDADLTPEHEDSGGFGGGIAYDDGRLFAATGFGEVVALDAKTGAEVWRRQVSGPVRGAPVARAGRVIVVSLDNQTHSLAADDGRPLWTHQGLSEIASLLGSSSPAIDGNVVVVPYSSGELYALRLENGAVQWSDSLAGLRRTAAVASIADIRGLPVIDRGRVFATSNSDIVAAIDLRSGRRIWERDIGGAQTPWIAGDFLYMVSTASELVALDARSGRVKWVTPLQRWRDEEDKKGPLVWTGPVLAGDRLIVVSSHGWALSVSPYTGEVLGREKMPDSVAVPPVVAGRSLYFLTDEADLIAYR